jgi:hypothetical protein
MAVSAFLVKELQHGGVVCGVEGAGGDEKR